MFVSQLSLLVLLVVYASSLVSAGNNTITDEVFFDIKISPDKWIGGITKGRIIIGIFGDAVPITAFNFIGLSKGFNHFGEKWHYRGCHFHLVMPDILIQSGDIIGKTGHLNGRSIYAPTFIDENFKHSHEAAGYVGMANNGVPDSNGSQFYITLRKSRWLDRKNVVLGKIVQGMQLVREINEIDISDNGSPKATILIQKSGVLDLPEPYDLTPEQLKSDEDIRPKPVTGSDSIKAGDL